MEDRERDPNQPDREDDPENAAAKHPTKDERQSDAERDAAADEAAADTFPASDAPAW